ncbi:hypothetical protein HK100_010766 [Physocladia obscura]|uniref:DUF1688-domain-containing protein n=1 Tax=Physocladia obscura TaxID=109957 RepID=A0AAD5T516_9FUNG|nr:hypothetical protein HK100_010766 [Physocladia obscura]
MSDTQQEGAQDLARQLRSLSAVRQTTRLALEHAAHLQHFEVSIDKIDPVVQGVLNLIARDYPSPAHVPFHSRWRHFEGPRPSQQRIAPLAASWQCSATEKVRRLVDLFVVSVLLDAGAGPDWSFFFEDKNGKTKATRSEGLALASLSWFLKGGFSASSTTLHRVDASILTSPDKISPTTLSAAFQVSDNNPLVGVEGRCTLLNRLGTVLHENPRFFYNKDNDDYRPGNMVDYILAHPSRVNNSSSSSGGVSVPVDVLWEVVMDGLSGVWPATRTSIAGISLGDVWPCDFLKRVDLSGAGDIPRHAAKHGYYFMAFHKLSQWLTYSLMEPFSLLNCTFTNMDVMTGLAEYRNGGLFVDMGVITLKPDTLTRGLETARSSSTTIPTEQIVPRFQVHDDAVVEWRALTVALLDVVGDRVRAELGMTAAQLPLVKVLEAGTWKLGREVAAQLRPLTKGPPIDIISDGTVF